MNIENKKQIAIILLAVGLGLVAAVLTGNHIQDSIQKETAKLSTDFENKKVKPLLQEISVLRQEVKQLASRPAFAPGTGEPGKGEAPSLPKSTLALRTPAGKRAYTVLIDSLSAVGGLINPGDYVDIISHMAMPDPTTNATSNISSMVFQNVLILAVGTSFQPGAAYEQQQNARSLNVTFALSPDEASLMSFIEKNGRMQLILRAPNETETQIIQAASWSALADYVFEKQGTELIIPRSRAVIEAVAPQQKQEVKPMIQIFKGGREL